MVRTAKWSAGTVCGNLGLLLAGLVILVFLVVGRYSETRMYRAYNRIVVGMDLADIQQMLGPGSRISENEVPQSACGPFVDGKRSSQPVVKGDVYYKWTGEINGCYIVISLVENQVREKYYWERSL